MTNFFHLKAITLDNPCLSFMLKVKDLFMIKVVIKDLTVIMGARNIYFPTILGLEALHLIQPVNKAK